jgi:hypothetical protein
MTFIIGQASQPPHTTESPRSKVARTIVHYASSSLDTQREQLLPVILGGISKTNQRNEGRKYINKPGKYKIKSSK